MSKIIVALLLLITYSKTVSADSFTNKIKLVDLFISENQIDSATICLDGIGKQIRNEKKPILQLAYFDRYAGIQKLKGNLECALAYYDSISKILPYIIPATGADSMLVARGYLSSATLLGEQNKFSESIDPYKKAILYSEAEPNNQFRSYYYQNIGFCYLRIGQVEDGLQCVNKAFKIYDANKDYAGKLGCLDYIANTMVDYQNFKLAKKYFDIALTLNDSTNNEYQHVSLFNNIGRMYNYEIQYDSALVYFNLALTESVSKKNNYLGAIALTNIGEVLMKQGNYDKAIFNLTNALSKFDSIQFDLGMFQTNHLMAFCEYKKGDLRKSEFLQDRAEKLMQKTAVYPSLLIDFYKRSYEMKKGFGNLKESLSFLEKYRGMQDSLNSILTNWKINEIESRLHTNIKEKQLAEKETELERNKMTIWFIITLFLITLISVIIIALYIRRRRDVIYQKQLSNMTALRMQNARNTMSPHFFFNLLASLSGLTTQPEVLKEKLRNLSLLLRKVIENIDRTSVTLEEELAAVKAFVNLYCDKIPEPFSVEYIIEEGTKLHGLIPAMMIQIPVENAIKHGLMPLEGEKKLIVSVTDFDGYQQITVSDNGIGLKASAGRSTGTGTGLKVLMQTIHLLNIKNQEKIIFSVSERNQDDPISPGTSVEIKIPANFNYST